MKKRLLVSMAVALVMSVLAGCGSDKDTEKNSVEADKTQVSDEVSEEIRVSELKVEDYVTLGEYKNLAVTTAAQETFTEEQVAAQALGVYQKYVTKDNGGVIDRAVATGDTVIIDYVGKKDGVAFAGGTAQGADLTIGSGQFIDGFEDGLIGVKPGETVDLNLTFPENYGNADLAGAKVVFTVTVHYILPVEMKDEVVAGFGVEDIKNVSELKQYCRTMLEEDAQYEYEQNLMAAVVDALIEKCTFAELPEDFMAQTKETLKADLSASAARYGMDGETLVNYFYGMDYDTFITENAEYSVKILLALQALAQKEGLILEEKELNQRIEQVALDNGWASSDQLLEQVDKEEIRENLMYEDVAALLLETAQVTHK